MKRLFKEPLVHFIVLGGALFIFHALWQSHVTKSEYVIKISAAELERQAVIFAGENRRQPTDEDLKALLFSHIEEEVLQREAVKLGLDEDDTIIRRRLAQKMRFMIEDADTPQTPDDDELIKWYDANVEMFRVPERRSFTHIYLSPESHRGTIEKDAIKLSQTVTDENWKSLGDPFIMKRDFEPLDKIALEQSFGNDFAKSVFALPDTGKWSAPIASAFGMHVVRLNKIDDGTTPAFADVKTDVIAAWQEHIARKTNRDNLKALIGKYKVDIEDLKTADTQ